jgi:hypothetical protein
MIWTAHKPTDKVRAKGRQWYSAEVEIGEGPKTFTATITPRRPMVSRHWGKGRKTSKSYIVYDVRVAHCSAYNFATVKAAKEFIEEYVAASNPAEREAVKREWDVR